MDEIDEVDEVVDFVDDDFKSADLSKKDKVSKIDSYKERKNKEYQANESISNDIEKYYKNENEPLGDGFENHFENESENGSLDDG